MKKMLVFILALSVASFAGEMFCNNGQTDVYGMHETSCYAVSSNFTFGVLQESDGSANYYFVDFNDILFDLGSEHNVPLRFIIYSNEPNFNANQAITQTAFATNAKLMVIFKSPYLSQNYTTVGANGRNLCYRYGGEGSSVVCHVEALTIQR